RAPEVDDLHASPQQLLCVLRDEIAHALRARARGVVDVDASRGLPHALAVIERARDVPADRVVEDEDARGAGRVLDERLGLRIVDAANLVFALEVTHARVMSQDREALLVERRILGDWPEVV